MEPWKEKGSEARSGDLLYGSERRAEAHVPPMYREVYRSCGFQSTMYRFDVPFFGGSTGDMVELDSN